MVKELIKSVAAALIIIGYGSFFTWVFVHIALNGYMKIIEPNSYIMWVEIILAPLLVLFGLERLIHIIRRK